MTVTVEGADMHAGPQFLIDVFGASTEQPVFVCSLPNSDARDREPPERRLLSRDPSLIERFIADWDRPDRAIYYCTATIQATAKTRSKATLAELNGLHVDIDLKDVLATREEVERRLRETQHLPSKVVFSGNGIHAYWLFHEGLPATAENVERVEALLRLLADHLGGDFSCAEASRLMRLPGTHNTKGGGWTEVTVVSDRPLRYDIDDLSEWLEVVSPVIHRKPTSGNGAAGTAEGVNPWTAVAELFGHAAPIDVEARLAEMRYQGTGDSAIHATQVSVSAALLNRGHPVDEVVSILLAATRAAAGSYGERWNWRREERAIRKMCETWLAKHPEIAEDAAREAPRDDGPAADTAGAVEVMRSFPGAEPLAAIPKRRWLHAGHYIAGQVVMTVAPGGWGKTSLIICNTVEMAIGRGLIGKPPTAGPIRVGYWNGEDEDDEIKRRIAAVLLRYNIDPRLLTDRLFLGSPLKDGRRFAKVDRHGNVCFDHKLLDETSRFIVAHELECMILDPLIAFHSVPESDNGAMEKLVKSGLGALAARTGCCIELSQHTRKTMQGISGELTADDARGAGSTINACRSVRVLNRMSAKEGEEAKIAPDERRHYLRVSREKVNLAPPGAATWIHLVPITLPNGDPGDIVQAAEPWEFPAPLDDVTVDDIRWMRATVREGVFRRDPRSNEWVGRPLAKHLRLGADDPGDRRRLNKILNMWFANGVLATETRNDKNRKPREFVVPGDWDEELDGV